MKLPLFPYPNVYRSEVNDGSALSISSICRRCPHKNCRKAKKGNVSECSYGFNFLRIDKDLLVFGFLLHERARCGQARKKRLQDHRDYVVKRKHLDNAVNAYLNLQEEIQNSIEEEKKRILSDYTENERFKTSFLQDMEEKIARGLSFVHDYRQINSQISQNINVLLESRYKGDSIDEKLAKATHAEVSIYHGSKLLEEKLNVAKFLLHPEWLEQPDRCKKFRLHGLVYKYQKIYKKNYDAKKVGLYIQGQSHENLVANPEACSVIPQTFIDNALKYSKKGGRVDIVVQDEPGGIFFSVVSFGPLIEEAERERIFDPFYRGVNAKKAVQEGAGYGLYVSQLIAKEHLGTLIEFEQADTAISGKGYETTFKIKFPLRAEILP